VNHERHDWTAFDALAAPGKGDARRAILDGSGWRMRLRHAVGTHELIAWSPRDFVAFWSRGYR
jgi:hypothetical protein